MPKSKKNLVVVESPAKAKTINKYLGSGYIVQASVGHIKDLKSYSLSVDIKNGFKPIYEVIRGKQKVIDEIKASAKNSESVLIATDPDREGEAIAWHIAEEVQKVNPNVKRLLFNEITKKGIENGLKQLRELDQSLYYSQQARRVLDRLIGFKVSPFVSNALVRKSKSALSAGRVQSVALRLICEREEDIQNFEPFRFWNIIANFEIKDKKIKARLVQFDDIVIKNPEGSQKPHRNETDEEFKERISQFKFIESEEQANELVKRILKERYSISKVKKTAIKQSPKPPFITSTLQQDAARKLGFANKLTMQLAQKLYEGIPIGNEGNVGLITYMRTDSIRTSNEAISQVRNYIKTTYGDKYLPNHPKIYASKSQNVQDAHEAIRPTDISYTPEKVKPYLDKSLFKLYELIYNRFVASQMVPAEIEQTTIDIQGGKFVFRATGRVVKFDGYLKIYEEDEQTNERSSEQEEDTKVKLPLVKEGEEAKIIDAIPKLVQTQPPPRYNSASLIKELEEKGIGRPSTYATIVSTILERKYIEQKNKAFFPTQLGQEVNRVLLKYFTDIFNVEFTARMEKELDTIAEGDKGYVEVVKHFYEPLENLLGKANSDILSNSEVACDVCGAPMVVRVSKFGRFLGCSRYPDCKNTKPLYEVHEKEVPEIVEDVRCDVCGKPMVIRESKYGKFYGCIDYPKCNGRKPIEETNNRKKSFEPVRVPSAKCPKCGKEMILRRGPKGFFLGCEDYPKCKGTKKITKAEAEKILSQKIAERNEPIEE